MVTSQGSELKLRHNDNLALKLAPSEYNSEQTMDYIGFCGFGAWVYFNTDVIH